MRKVYPFLRSEYFHDESERVVFNEISKFIDRYQTCPTIESLGIQLQKSDDIKEHVFESVDDIITQIQDKTEINQDWLTENTEKFCKDKSVYNAIMQSLQIISGESKTQTEDSIPSILQEALGVCFDTNVGHDYFANEEERFAAYHRKESRIPFDIEMLNRITNGGLPKKSLTALLAPTGVGKTMVMCHFAAAFLAISKNVLYISMEMSEEGIAERIDSNMMDVPVRDIKGLTKPMFESRIKKIRDRTQGNLIIKEYPTASAHSGHFKMLLNELRLKKNFVPDVIFIDYLNICASSRYKASSAVNSYTLVKSIAEELRGMAVEYDVPIITATQTNRNGMGNSDIELTDTSESSGLTFTVDCMIALISTEDLEKMNQLMMKQLKNRWGDINKHKRFVVGIDRSKMRLFDIDQSYQKNLDDSGNDDLEDNSFVGTRKNRTTNFSDFKV